MNLTHVRRTLRASAHSKDGAALFCALAFGALAVFLAPFAVGVISRDRLAIAVPVGQWIPALAVVAVARLTGRRGLLPSRRRPPWRALAVTTGAFAGVLAVHLGLGLTFGLFSLDGSQWPLVWVVLPTAVVLMLATLGEEIGWRGYLLSQWSHVGPWLSSAAVATVWAAWHVPLLALYVHDGAMSVAAAAASTVNLACAGVLLGILRLRFASLWPAVFGHALINSLFVWGYGTMNPALHELGPLSFWVFNALGWLLLLTGAVLTYRHRSGATGS